MKQKLIITAFCALAIAACTSKQNKGGEAAKSAETESVTNGTGAESAANGEASEIVSQNAENKSLKPIFLLANEDGSKFLVKPNSVSVDNAPDYLKNYKYILYEGKYYKVDFKGLQEGNKDADNGRDTPYNYDNCRGWYYEMQNGGKLLTNPQSEYDVFWGTPLLVDETFKNETKLLDVKKFDVEEAPVDVRDVEAKFEKLYGKKAIKFKLDAIIGDYNYYVIQFETVENKALGAVALVKSDGTTITKDFPREWDEFSTWREGDEGEFYGYDVLFATIESGLLTLYTYNGGEEGASYQNYVVQGNTLVEGAVSNYFYFAAE